MFYVYKSIQKGEEIMDKNKEFKPYIPADGGYKYSRYQSQDIYYQQRQQLFPWA